LGGLRVASRPVLQDANAVGLGARIVGLKSLSYSYGGGAYREMSRDAPASGLSIRGGAEEYSQMIVPREVTTTVTVNATYELEYLAGE
jgi:hypothetical protein